MSTSRVVALHFKKIFPTENLIIKSNLTYKVFVEQGNTQSARNVIYYTLFYLIEMLLDF